jgi:putative transposase
MPFRLYPTRSQDQALQVHFAHARFVWNLAVEQHNSWRPGRASAPGYLEQARQLTAARVASDWLSRGSPMVQQQALRDFARAKSDYFAGTHRHPTWRKRYRNEGFRIVSLKTQHVVRLNRRWGQVLVPKVGWVRFRWTRTVPHAKSYRVTRDRAGRWHIGFAVTPPPIASPGNGQVVGIDRGVKVSAALSTGEGTSPAGLTPGEQSRLLRLLRARATSGSRRKMRLRTAIARLIARKSDRRKDWVEKTSTDLARQFDIIRVEDLRIQSMTKSARGTIERPGQNVAAKAGLNRGILSAGWGSLVARLEDKAPGRIEKVRPAYTSQNCSECGHISAENRKSQAVFSCVNCGHRSNADINAARNIAAGRAGTARRGTFSVPETREPQHASSGGRSWNPSPCA